MYSETVYALENIGAHASGGGAHLWEGGFTRHILRANKQKKIESLEL